MKKACFFLYALLIILASCSKSDDPSPTPAADNYMSTTAGSSWNYQFRDNITTANSKNYTLTSTNRDSTAGTRSYHVYENNNGPNEYYNINVGDYYTLQAFSLGGADTTLENLYLKSSAAVNTTWSQSYTIDVSGTSVQVNLTNKIQERGLAKTVGANNYTDVIHVVTTISIPMLATLPGSTLTTDIHYYYAPKYGMIQNDAKIDLVAPLLTLNEHIDTQTKLVSATIL